MPSALEEKIAHVASLVTCRHCGKIVPADVGLCECRAARGELPHTEWNRDVKRWLCLRAVERNRLEGMSEQFLFEKLLTGNYAGTIRKSGVSRIVIPFTASVITLYPYAVEDVATWVAAGRPTNFTI